MGAGPGERSKASDEPPPSPPPRHFRPQPGDAAAHRDRRGGVPGGVPLVQPAREGFARAGAPRLAARLGGTRAPLWRDCHRARGHRSGRRDRRRWRASAGRRRSRGRTPAPADGADRRLGACPGRGRGAAQGRRRLRDALPDLSHRQQARLRPGGRPRRARRRLPPVAGAGRRPRRHRRGQHRRLSRRRGARHRRHGRDHARRRPRSHRAAASSRPSRKNNNASPQRSRRIRKGREGDASARSASQCVTWQRRDRFDGRCAPGNPPSRPLRILRVLCDKAFLSSPCPACLRGV